jgi:hypothetical protein
MKKQVKDFNAATSLNGATDFFLMQRVASDGVATTMKVQFSTLKLGLMQYEDTDTGGGTSTPSLTFSPLVRIIGKNGPVTGITPLTNTQLFITDVGDAVGIDLVSAVHRTSRINFRHGDTDFAANIYTCGSAYTPIGGARKFYIDVGNPTAVNRLEIGERFSVFYKDVYIVNGTLTFDTRESGVDSLPGSHWPVLHLQNVSEHAIMDILSSPSHSAGIYFRQYNSNNECRMYFTGYNYAFNEEQNAFFIYNNALKPGTNDIDSTNLSRFRLGRFTSDLSVPLTINQGYISISHDGVTVDGTPTYEGGQLNLMCPDPTNVHTMYGCVDFLKGYATTGAYSDLSAVPRSQYPHWAVRNFFQIPTYSGSPTMYEMMSDGSFLFLYNKSAPHFTGPAQGLPKFIIAKLAGGGNVQADIYGNISIASSDQRLKTNIQDLAFGLTSLEQLRPVQFNWIPNDMFVMRTNVTDFGLIAQEVESVFPNLVAENPEGYKTIDYTKFIPILIKCIKELAEEVNTLKGQIQ